MVNDELDPLAEEEHVLTPDDGFRLVVRLMRRYIDREQRTYANIQKIYRPYMYSQVRLDVELLDAPQD